MPQAPQRHSSEKEHRHSAGSPTITPVVVSGGKGHSIPPHLQRSLSVGGWKRSQEHSPHEPPGGAHGQWQPHARAARRTGAAAQQRAGGRPLGFCT
eukprot:1158926-Pelagomonas_calceolata.AAC.12